MLKFVDYVKTIFPNIDPYIESETKKSLLQFKETGKSCGYSTTYIFDYLSQGDIIEGIPFSRISADGSISAFRGKGIVLSNTCSCDHDDSILVAPFIDISKYGKDRSTIKDNLNYKLMYLPEYKDLVIDFSLSNAINKNLIKNQIESGAMRKERTLNVIGFYLLIAKLTVCFLRPENAEVQSVRKDKYYSSISSTT